MALDGPLTSFRKAIISGSSPPANDVNKIKTDLMELMLVLLLVERWVQED